MVGISRTGRAHGRTLYFDTRRRQKCPPSRCALPPSPRLRRTRRRASCRPRSRRSNGRWRGPGTVRLDCQAKRGRAYEPSRVPDIADRVPGARQGARRPDRRRGGAEISRRRAFRRRDRCASRLLAGLVPPSGFSRKAMAVVNLWIASRSLPGSSRKPRRISTSRPAPPGRRTGSTPASAPLPRQQRLCASRRTPADRDRSARR